MPIADQAHDAEDAITYQEGEIGSVLATPAGVHVIGGVAIDCTGFNYNQFAREFANCIQDGTGRIRKRIENTIKSVGFPWMPIAGSSGNDLGE